MKIDFEEVQKLKTKTQKDKDSDRFQNVLYFLSSKGLLKTVTTPRIIRNKSIDISDVLWAARIEPRILEVFPSAYIHFPLKFKNISKAPSKLLNIIEQIKSGVIQGDNFKGIKYEDMKKWCNIKLNDSRTIPLNQKKKLRSFFLSPSIERKLTRLAKEKKTTKSHILEIAIQKL